MRILDGLEHLMRQRIRSRGGRSVFRVIGGRRMHAYEVDGWGPGPAAVLVHGLGASGTTFMRLMFELRRSWRRIYVPDLPGHGFSPLEPGEQPLDVPGHYDALTHYLDTVVGEPSAMIGNSLGGALSLRRAIDRPDTAALGLLSPAGAPMHAEHFESLRASYEVTDTAGTLDLLDRMFHRRPPLARLVTGDLRRTFSSSVVQRVLASAQGAEGIDPSALRALPMPITLVWGESERLLPEEGLEFFRAHLPPQASVVVLDRCGHLPQMERPRRTLRLLEALAEQARNHAHADSARVRRAG